MRTRHTARLHTAQTAHAVALATGALPAAVTNGSEFGVAWDALGIAQHHDSLPGTMASAQSFDTPNAQSFESCPVEMPLVDGLDRCKRTADPSKLVLEDYTARLDEADAATRKLTITLDN